MQTKSENRRHCHWVYSVAFFVKHNYNDNLKKGSAWFGRQNNSADGTLQLQNIFRTIQYL